MEQGFVKLHRKILSSGLMQNQTALQVFIYLLLKAQYKPRTVLVHGQEVHLEPGQVVTGRAKLAAELGISEKQARTSLEGLQKGQIVAIKGASKFSIVTICNWSTYQVSECDEGPTEGPEKGLQNVTERATKQELRNINTPLPPSSCEEGGSVADAPATSFVPPSLDQVRDYILAHERSVDPVEFWTKYSEDGWTVQGRPMKSWKQTINTWHSKRSKPRQQIVDPLASKWSTPPEPPVVKAKREEIEAEYVPLMKKLRDEGNWKRASEIERIMDETLEAAGVAPWLR